MRYMFIILTLFIQVNFACEKPVLVTEFHVSSKKYVKAPPTPDFKVEHIYRAKRADTCGYGIATIMLSLKTPQKTNSGYIFEIVKGKLESNFRLSQMIAINAYNRSLYPLEWNDGNSNTQEPFDIVLKITGISVSGAKSQPQFLRVRDKGIHYPWWNIWKRLPFSVTQVIESH